MQTVHVGLVASLLGVSIKHVIIFVTTQHWKLRPLISNFYELERISQNSRIFTNCKTAGYEFSRYGGVSAILAPSRNVTSY